MEKWKRWLFAVVLAWLGLMVGCGSTSVIGPDFLTRISQSSSTHYGNYLEYKRERLSKDGLIQRLPHVAMIGDSLSQDFYISSILSSIWRAKTRHGRNWFLDSDKSKGSIYSLYERLDTIIPFVATEYSSVGGDVDSGEANDSFLERLIKPHNFSRQIDQILQKSKFPDLLLIWIGHNKVDWTTSLGPDEREEPERHLQELALNFRNNYTRQLKRLLDRAQKEKHKMVITVFGLVNFEAFFQARQTAETIKAKDSKRYPYLEKCYKTFESMKPEYRSNMIRLALMMNAELQNLVREMSRELKNYPTIHLEYSDAFAKADISAVEMIHPVDAWHPSPKGHNHLAETAFKALRQSLQFLGISSK